VVLGFIGAAGDNMTICFPRKRMPFCFNHLRDSDVRSRSQKVGSLKDFEIHGVLEKESLRNGQKLPTRSHNHLPEINKESFGESARSAFVRTQHLIRRYQEVKQLKTCLTLMIGTDQRSSHARLS
jgi:hypothetical protein